METENVPDRSNNISVSIGLQNVMDCYRMDQNAIRYYENIVWISLIKLLAIKFCFYSWSSYFLG